MKYKKKTDHPLFKLWCNTRSVCNNPNSRQWHHYGGRGIKFCRDWDQDFWAFAEYMDTTLGARPGPEYVLDRINNDRGYRPGNLRWATRREDSNNRRTNHCISYQGRKQTFADWSRETGIPLTTIWSRIIDKGWSVSEALGFKNRVK